MAGRPQQCKPITVDPLYNNTHNYNNTHTHTQYMDRRLLKTTS